IDAWFEGWTIAATLAREELFTRIARLEVVFRDRYSNIEGLPDLLAHIAAAQRHMPGVGLERKGDVRQCQGVVLSDWVARTGDQELMSGTSVFTMAPDGRIESVVGVTNPPPPSKAQA